MIQVIELFDSPVRPQPFGSIYMKILYAGSMDLGVEKGDTLHFAQLAKALQSRGHELTVLARGNSVFPGAQGLNIKLSPARRIPGASLLVNDCQQQFFLGREIAFGRYDIIYQRGIPWLNRWVGYFGLPTIVEVNGVRTDELKLDNARPIKQNYARLREKQTVAGADKIICVTEGIRRQLQVNYGVDPQRCTVIPNAADTDLFFPRQQALCQQKLGVSPTTYNIGFVGAFQTWVDFTVLLHALQRLHQEGIPACCIFIGDGLRLQEVMALSEQLNLTDYVRFAGRASHNAVPEWIGAFDVCVAPFTRARNELIGLSPLKLFEYMACKRPVVATAMAGITDVIEESGGGVVYAPESVEELAQQLSHLHHHPELRRDLGERGHSYVVNQYSWNHVAEKVESIMVDLVSG